MPKKSNAEIEKYYFEMFRRNYSLPDGIICYGDMPDVILKGERKVGIEIRRFFLEEGKSLASEQRQRKKRKKVVSEAQHIYQMESGKKVELTFGFDKANPIQDQDEMIKKFVRFAKHIEGYETGKIGKYIFKNIHELSYVYVNAEEYEDAKWRIAQVYEVPILSRERLKEIVKEKEELSKRYRKCDVYWLLVIVDFVDNAQDQEIQIDDFEKIDSQIFEKILVYKTVFGHVLEGK